ncbi:MULTISPECIES: TetR/AcrR family transcriptional regulator [unclassified Mycobacterium]|uniref:TetR/AcrR family transcriptional regulator n=1 Tax=unclassified Mycobacterium TaxID=2642494 RepID=UPI0029C74930|nr:MULTISPECIES: TetR/AcrR family transcriptional regulator [unclassified Mycobacterium]
MRPRLVHDDALLDLMLAAFADLGYDGTSLRQLCRHLGVNHNLIYERFQSKEGAWTAAIDHAFQQVDARVFQPPVESQELVDSIRTLMRRWVDVTIEQPALARIIHQESARPGSRFDYLRDTYIVPVQEQARVALTLGQERGVFREGAIAAAYFFLNTWGVGGIAASQELARSVGPRDQDPRETAYLAIDIVLDGLRVGTESRRRLRDGR